MMRKLKPSRQGFLEYIRLSNLPEKQLGTLLKWLPQTFLTKINENEHLMDDCIEYEDYEFWYDHCYERGLEFLEEQI